jgi:hypothetical protein
MHIDGRHVGALTLDGSVKGSNVYTRLVGHGDGGVGIEVVVAQIDGTKKPSRVELTPHDIAQHTVVKHAMETDMRTSLAAFEAGTPVRDDGDHPNR